MNVTRQWYENYQARRASSGAKLEQRAGHEPLETPQVKEGDSAKFSVIVTSYRRRLLDEDNLCEKYHVDALRYAGILPSDDPATTHITVKQVKVATKAQERTEISVTEIG